MSKVNTFLLMSKESGHFAVRALSFRACMEAVLEDLLEARDVLKLYDISRATLTRWMNPDWASHRKIEPFPQGRMKDGRTKVWRRDEVARWVERNQENLGRHPKPASPVVDRSASVELTLGQAYEAATRVAEEDQTGFDYGVFEERFIYPMTDALFQALRSRGVQGAVWVGDKFAFIFPEGDEGDRQAVAFKLAFA